MGPSRSTFWCVGPIFFMWPSIIGQQCHQSRIFQPARTMFLRTEPSSHPEIRAFQSRSQFVPLLGSGPRGDQDALNACRGKENANRWVNMPSLKPVPIIPPGSSWKFNCLRCVITWNTSIRIFIYTKKMTNSNLYFPHYETLVRRWEDNG